MDPLQESFVRDGFVLISNGIERLLIEKLRRAVEPIVEARGDAVRHQTLLEPKLFDPAFVEFLNVSSINRAAERMLGTDELSFAGLAVLLGRARYDLCAWHRDFHDADPELAAMLADPRLLIQFNCALYDDQSLWVVPGSHVRPSFDGETAFANCPAPPDCPDFRFAATPQPNPLEGMPGSINVRLKAGDCLLYNPILWHAAEYRPQWKRATLHGGWRKWEAVPRFKNLRWGLNQNPWLLEPAYLGELGGFFGPQLQRWQQAYQRWA